MGGRRSSACWLVGLPALLRFGQQGPAPDIVPSYFLLELLLRTAFYHIAMSFAACPTHPLAQQSRGSALLSTHRTPMARLSVHLCTFPLWLQARCTIRLTLS